MIGIVKQPKKNILELAGSTPSGTALGLVLAEPLPLGGIALTPGVAFVRENDSLTWTRERDNVELRWDAFERLHDPDLLVGFPKVVIHGTALRLVVLEASDLEPLLDLLPPILQARPLNPLAWVSGHLCSFALTPPHHPIPPGVVVGKGEAFPVLRFSKSFKIACLPLGRLLPTALM